MTTVVGYARPPRPDGTVSVDHMDAFRVSAARQGLALMAVYTDQPPGPLAAGDRRALLTALCDLRERRAAGLLLLDLNDLSWQPDSRATLLRLVAAAGGTVYLAGSGPLSASAPDTPSGRLLSLVGS